MRRARPGERAAATLNRVLVVLFISLVTAIEMSDSIRSGKRGRPPHPCWSIVRRAGSSGKCCFCGSNVPSNTVLASTHIAYVCPGIPDLERTRFTEAVATSGYLLAPVAPDMLPLAKRRRLSGKALVPLSIFTVPFGAWPRALCLWRPWWHIYYGMQHVDRAFGLVLSLQVQQPGRTPCQATSAGLLRLAQRRS